MNYRDPKAKKSIINEQVRNYLIVIGIFLTVGFSAVGLGMFLSQSTTAPIDSSASSVSQPAQQSTTKAASPGSNVSASPVASPGSSPGLTASPVASPDASPTVEATVEASPTVEISPTPIVTPSPTPSPTPVFDKFDLNEDGKLNTLDYTVFLDLYSDKDLKVDYNDDGQINPLDFIPFSKAYIEAQGSGSQGNGQSKDVNTGKKEYEAKGVKVNISKTSYESGEDITFTIEPKTGYTGVLKTDSASVVAKDEGNGTFKISTIGDLKGSYPIQIMEYVDGNIKYFEISPDGKYFELDPILTIDVNIE